MNNADSVTRVIEEWASVMPELDVSPLSILARIAKIRTLALARQEAVFRDFDLTPADFVTIVTLRRRPKPYRLSQTDLAHALGLSAGTVSVRVDRLVRLGLATRTRCTQDSRVQWIELTREGESVFRELAPLHLAQEERLLDSLSPSQRAELASLLQVWLANLESAEQA